MVGNLAVDFLGGEQMDTEGSDFWLACNTPISNLPVWFTSGGEWEPRTSDLYFIAEQTASAPHNAHPEGCAALCIVLVSVPRVSRSCEHYPDGFDPHFLHLPLPVYPLAKYQVLSAKAVEKVKQISVCVFVCVRVECVRVVYVCVCVCACVSECPYIQHETQGAVGQGCEKGEADPGPETTHPAVQPYTSNPQP